MPTDKVLHQLSAVYGLIYVYTDPSVETLWMEIQVVARKVCGRLVKR